MPPYNSDSLDCHERLSLPSDTNQVNPGSTVTNATANILLSKSLKVDLEKLPTVMTSMVTSKNHPSLMFKRSSESHHVGSNHSSSSRKRYATALSNNQRTGNKKCPRFVSSDQRKTCLNKTIPGSKELLLHPNLFNSFRITKPKSNIKCDINPSATSTKCNESKSSGVNGIHFKTQSFYKFSDSALSPNSHSHHHTAVNKQSDLIPPTSVPSSTVFSNKTEANDRVCSKINLLEPTPGSYSVRSHLGSTQLEEAHDQTETVTSNDNQDNAVFALPNPKKIRFPAVPNSSAIQCKWEGCGECFKTHGNLSDHIKVINCLC